MYILTTTSNIKFAQGIAQHLGEELIECQISRFHNGEVRIKNIEKSMREQDVYIIFSVGNNINDELVEAMILVHACKKASAKSVTIILPFYPYARQDKKSQGREPISAKWVADVLGASGVDKIMTVDVHNGTIQGMSNCIFDNLTGIPLFAEYISHHMINPYMETGGVKDDFVIISPDAGGTERAKNLANILGLEMATMYKSRSAPGEIGSIKLLGEVKGKIAIIVDDMVDTCGTLKKASEELANEIGTSNGNDPIIYAFATHAPLSNNALQNIADSKLTSLFVTNSVNLYDKVERCEKIHCISITNLIASAILRYHRKDSISEMLKMSSSEIDRELEVYRQQSKLSTDDMVCELIKTNKKLMAQVAILDSQIVRLQSTNNK